MSQPARRILLVHAHPDDEVISNGATMARYVEEGAQVTLVTCTLGEMGEVLVPELEHLAADRDDALGPHREKELAEAMRILGVTDHRFLGGAGHFRDSGMKWDENGNATAADDIHENAFWHADLLEASDLLVEIIREVRPQVLVTYDEFGNYGHPDHVQAHRVATYATALAAGRSYRHDLGEAWDIPKVYWAAMSASALREGIKEVREAGDLSFMEGMDPDNLPPFAFEDDDIDAIVDGTPWVDAKLDSMRAHATQIAVDGPFFALSNDIAQRAWGREFYRLVKGVAVKPEGSAFEDDLFAGTE
ncbi:N-acetyl-1-D-myo-inositol-2-amino-2-deoxy-alpha-D-glucopyranoside deacetylase [Aeromicrobium sp. Root495]|uniref:N-acetyl-1-D-myo-inositol-2-amino-2-deoxy-alpha- D-glucopyranoside deacetylase n=1 Tax=Aeromicrobium sp. Root495 TaxID=1736550 RepID=UPI0006F3AD74|nr:N-acetyl-1-D-myo-inositol-2-amino-2-deoxy-alpha-D-glucopyranoside deacetylase [Aeromicrobium sp. Root495]KQY59947.1 N-acetyl-1-D-myo-inositol-2-amino-2-deoxy-alpha-D-glucopyranoside deacetylase [Aeromicrobium sp. Root495]